MLKLSIVTHVATQYRHIVSHSGNRHAGMYTISLSNEGKSGGNIAYTKKVP